MGNINDGHGGAADGATFPVAMYVIFLSYLALFICFMFRSNTCA
jgi:hypothetical protein